MGKPLSEETKRKISEAKKGRKRAPFSEEWRARMGASKRGKPKTEEHRQKIGDAHRGKVYSPETREKIAAARRGTSASPETRAKLSASHTGLRHSAETRQKIAESAKGRETSAEARAKSSASHRGKKMPERSAKTRQKLSQALTGRVVSEETKQKLRELMLRRLQEQPQTWRHTRPELRVQEALRGLGISFETHVSEGGFNWDIRTEDGTLIEVNGCYWHGCGPCGFGGRHPEKVARDEARRLWAEEAGRTLLVIWEHDLPNPNLSTL